MEGYIEIEKYDEVVTQYATYKLETDQKLAALQFQLEELQRLIHGAKSERYVPELPAEQLSLFEQERKAIEEQYTKQVAAHERKKSVAKKKPYRLVIPTHLRVEEEILLPDLDTSNMVRIGAAYTRTLAYTPAEVYVKLLTRPKFVERPVRVGEQEQESDLSNSTTLQEEPSPCILTEERRAFLEQKGPIYIATMPSRFIDKCKADVSLLCSIIVDKYVDHLPLFRTQGRLQRLAAAKIPLSTMCGWIGQSATNLLPLYEKLILLVLASTYLQVDETRMEVLPQKTEGLEEEKGSKKAKAPPDSPLKNRRNKKGKNKKRKTHRGYLYGYLAMSQQLLFFEYDKTRTADNPLRRLKDYTGTIQTDCYEIYDQVRKAYQDAFIHYHCLNHARRNFEKALSNDAVRADHALGQFQRLYAIEKVAKDKNWTAEKIYQVRQEQAKPILAALFDWMDIEYDKVLPQSPIAKAIAYMLPRKERMMHYLSDGHLNIDNNPIENKIRPIAVGRRNYLFAGSHQAAQWGAMFYSFFACCRLHQVDPAEWLEDVMRRLPDHPINQIEQLLPHLWKIEKEKQQQTNPPITSTPK